jgi:hypothetical protein
MSCFRTSRAGCILGLAAGLAALSLAPAQSVTVAETGSPINYEYAVVSEQQPNPQIAVAISNFLLWCISPQCGGAASFLAPVNFIALPTPIRARSELQIARIQ